MKSILAVLLAAAISTSAALAGEIADRAMEAEKLLQAGNGAGALEQFRSAEDALWQAMPLAVLNVRQIDTASGFGIYSERVNHIYKPSEKIVLYMDLLGMATAPTGSATA
jgi:hypothetical protein